MLTEELRPVEPLVRDIMTSDVKSVGTSERVEHLVAIFLEHGISACPVIDEKQHPVGIVSKTDIVRELTSDAERRSGSATRLQPWWSKERLAHATAGEIMTETLYALAPTTTVKDAMAAVAFEGIHHLPVVSETGELVGVLAALDLLAFAARENGYEPTSGLGGRVFRRVG